MSSNSWRVSDLHWVFKSIGVSQILAQFTQVFFGVRSVRCLGTDAIKNQHSCSLVRLFCTIQNMNRHRAEQAEPPIRSLRVEFNAQLLKGPEKRHFFLKKQVGEFDPTTARLVFKASS